ncbi:MAG: 30S ribosomal protein S18 [Patescibacteria group bacterium]
MTCSLCQRNLQEVNFKETEMLQRFISGSAKIRSRKKTGLCSKHQRHVAKAIKRARNFGFLSSTTK